MLADIETNKAAKESAKQESTRIKTDGDEEKKQDSEEEDKANLAIDLTFEQEEEVERRAFEKSKSQIVGKIDNAISKAAFVLKMILPEAYLKEKNEEITRELSRKQS